MPAFFVFPTHTFFFDWLKKKTLFNQNALLDLEGYFFVYFGCIEVFFFWRDILTLDEIHLLCCFYIVNSSRIFDGCET